MPPAWRREPAVRVVSRWMAGLVAGSPLARATAYALAELVRRAPGFRPGTSLAFHLGQVWSDGLVWGRLRSGSWIRLDLHDHHHRHLFFHGEIEPETTTLVRRLLRRGDVFIDVGANGGYYSLLAHDLGARVLAFEPDPALFAMLQDSSSRASSDAGLQLCEAACGARSGQALLHRSDERGNTGLASLQAGPATGEAIPVRVTMLDEECRQRGLVPDVVKVDTEGHELEVLRGMEGLLAAGSPGVVICEVAAGGRVAPESIVDFLDGFGYTARQIAEDGSMIELGSVGRLENLCFLREERSSLFQPQPGRGRGLNTEDGTGGGGAAR